MAFSREGQTEAQQSRSNIDEALAKLSNSKLIKENDAQLRWCGLVKRHRLIPDYSSRLERDMFRIKMLNEEKKMYLILFEKLRVKYNEKCVAQRCKLIARLPEREPFDEFAFQQSIKDKPNFAS